MAEDDKIKYSDIIEPDDSIERLIKQLGELNQQYEVMVNAIRAGADKVVHALKSASGATKSGRKDIDDATEAASRLDRAYKELQFAISDTGKQVAWLKAQTSDQNRISVEQQRYMKAAISSYDRLKSDLKQTVDLYKSLTAAERADSQMGQQLLSDIINLKNQIKILDDQMKPHIQTVGEVEKAEQKLAFLRSEEGKRLIELKAKISELTGARKQEKAVVDPLTQAKEKLAYAQSDENAQLKLYSTQIKEANRIAQLQIQIANSAEGSYNRLSAQYALNKIRLNQMSGAEREAADSGKKLEAETNAIYQQMIKLQEATGNYKLSVGNYKNIWDGLGFSITQVVRELPAAAVSLNTFFLGISNNVPLVIDEIIRLRKQNELLKAEGKATISITGSIVKSLLSWNTILVILLTTFSMFGDEIISWVKSLFKGKDAVISMGKALNNVAKELEETNNSYGDNITSLKQLQHEWKNLKLISEKNQWINDNKQEFDNLGITINSVADAENAFVNNTEAVINALKLRAKAAAAQKLAAEQYEKALIATNKAENEGRIVDESHSFGQVLSAMMTARFSSDPSKYGGVNVSGLSYEARLRTILNQLQSAQEQNIAKLNDEAKAANATGDAYFKLAAGYEDVAKSQLNAAKIEESHKKIRGKEPRDLTNIINQNSIKIQKQYEESITNLQNDEFAKRRKSAADRVQDENNKLREMYRKNEEYVKNVDNKYKQLTESQKKQISQQQKWITDTIANNLELLTLQLQQIEKEQQISSLKIRRETINAVDTGQAVSAAKENQPLVTTGVSVFQNVSGIEQSLIQERKLVEENLELEYALIIETNRKLRESGDEHARSEEEIIIELNKKKLELWAQYDQQILDVRKQNIKDQLDLVKKGSDEELKLLLEQNEIARQAALAANAAKPASQQISTSAINAKFDKSGAEIRGSFELTNFDEQQALNEAIFNEVKRNETEITRFKLEQEKARWQEQIRLAESGGLDWSQAQIDAAKSTVKSIDRELSELDNFKFNIGKKGLGTTLLEKLGFDDSQIDALKDAVDIVVEQLQSIIDTEVQLAEKAVSLAEERVEVAQEAYDAEVEARNNGYANRLVMAKKELEQEKRNQQDKQKLLEEAQRRQENINSITQSSSLITASANLWSSFSSIPIVGPALAMAAIATMWASFIAAKIKAKQLTAIQSQEYGEGGLEFLEGGSHASGNDIDLGVTNKNKKRMRAEGGEALAIINKKNTKKYKSILPDVIDSFNKGIFEDKYSNAFKNSGQLFVSNVSPSIDTSTIENKLEEIRKQGEVKYIIGEDGSIMIIEKNIKRIIKK